MNYEGSIEVVVPGLSKLHVYYISELDILITSKDHFIIDNQLVEFRNEASTKDVITLTVTYIGEL